MSDLWKLVESSSNNNGDSYKNVTLKSEFGLLQTLSPLFHLVCFVQWW